MARDQTKDQPKGDRPTPASSDSKGNGSSGNPRLTARERSLLRAASLLVERKTFADRHGFAFDTAATAAKGFKRDLFFTLGYPAKIEIDAYRSRYERGDIAERIVEIYPRATWTGGVDLVEDPDPGVTTPFEEAFASLADRLNLWAKLRQADILAGLGRYGVLLLGTKSGTLKQPLASLSSPDDLIYLKPLAEDKATIKPDDLVKESTDPRFGLPEFYTLDLGGTKTSVKAHWTRILHVAEGTLDDEVYGKPRLRAVWNRLMDLDKLLGAGAEAAWNRMDPGFHVDIPADIELGQQEEDDLEDEMEEFQHGLSRRIMTRGDVSVTPLNAVVSNYGPNVQSTVEFILATVGVPKRIFFGSERGEQASTQDRNNWNDRVAERRGEFGNPLIREFVSRLGEVGALEVPDEYEILWPESEELDEAEKAEVADKLAAANQKQAAAGGGLVITTDEIRDQVLDLGPMEEQEDEGQDDPDAIDADEPPVDDSEPEALRRLRAAKLRLCAARGLTPERFRYVDKPADEPDWKAVHRAADSNVDSLARVVRSAWDEFDFDEDDLVAALESVNIRNLSAADSFEQEATRDAALDRVLAKPLRLLSRAIEATVEPALDNLLPDRLHQVLVDGGLAALRTARSRGSFFRGASSSPDPDFRAGQLDASFEATNPRAIEWAATRAAALVTEITPELVTGLRELIAGSLLRGVPPRVLARDIRALVGIRSDQARAVANLASRLAVAKPGSIVRAGNIRIRVPRTGITEALIRLRASEYAKRLRNYRARLIARSETMRSANQGQKELWLQARDAGLLRATAKRVWIVTPDDRLRDEHAAVAGQVRGLEEPFDVPDGSTEPGEAPNCRCGQGIARDIDIQRAQGIAA